MDVRKMDEECTGNCFDDDCTHLTCGINVGWYCAMGHVLIKTEWLNDMKRKKNENTNK